MIKTVFKNSSFYHWKSPTKIIVPTEVKWTKFLWTIFNGKNFKFSKTVFTIRFLRLCRMFMETIIFRNLEKNCTILIWYISCINFKKTSSVPLNCFVLGWIVHVIFSSRKLRLLQWHVLMLPSSEKNWLNLVSLYLLLDLDKSHF